MMVLDYIHKSHNAPAPFASMHHGALLDIVRLVSCIHRPWIKLCNYNIHTYISQRESFGAKNVGSVRKIDCYIWVNDDLDSDFVYVFKITLVCVP